MFSSTKYICTPSHRDLQPSVSVLGPSPVNATLSDPPSRASRPARRIHPDLVPTREDPPSSGELVEPFGPEGRITSPFGYRLLRWPRGRISPECLAFEQWVLAQAAVTRAAIAA